MPIEPLLREQAVDFLPPLGRRGLPYTTSRILVRPDRSTEPVLQILAREKFGSYDKDLLFPFWVDGNPENETLENVELATRQAKRVRT